MALSKRVIDAMILKQIGCEFHAMLLFLSIYHFIHFLFLLRRNLHFICWIHFLTYFRVTIFPVFTQYSTPTSPPLALSPLPPLPPTLQVYHRRPRVTSSNLTPDLFAFAASDPPPPWRYILRDRNPVCALFISLSLISHFLQPFIHC